VVSIQTFFFSHGQGKHGDDVIELQRARACSGSSLRLELMRTEDAWKPSAVEMRPA